MASLEGWNFTIKLCPLCETPVRRRPKLAWRFATAKRFLPLDAFAISFSEA
jgi:hypothetical protein